MGETITIQGGFAQETINRHGRMGFMIFDGSMLRRGFVLSIEQGVYLLANVRRTV